MGQIQTLRDTKDPHFTTNLRVLGPPFHQLPDWCAIPWLGELRVSPFDEPTLYLMIDGCLPRFFKSLGQNTLNIWTENNKGEGHHCWETASGWPLTRYLTMLPAWEKCCPALKCCGDQSWHSSHPIQAYQEKKAAAVTGWSQEGPKTLGVRGVGGPEPSQ